MESYIEGCGGSGTGGLVLGDQESISMLTAGLISGALASPRG